MDDQEAVQNIATNIYGDVCLRKARRKRHKLLITELFFDYTKNTTFHGIPYFTKRGLTIAEKLPWVWVSECKEISARGIRAIVHIEFIPLSKDCRIFWVITCIVSASLCAVSIHQLWCRWQESPVIVTISEKIVPVGMVPLPSITICPQAKCKVSVYNHTKENIQIQKIVYEYSRILKAEKNISFSIAKNMILKGKINLDKAFNSSIIERMKKYNDINQICKHNLIALPSTQKYVNSSMIEFLHKVSPNHGDIFHGCKQKTATNCASTFEKVLTKEGVCFTANSLPYTEIFRTEEIQSDYKYLFASIPSKGWDIEKGYKRSVKYPYPKHSMENAATPELIVELVENTTDRNELCNTFNNGFKVYIHHPADLPQSSQYYYAVINNQVSSIALSFNVINTSESLRSYAPDTRQCYFSNERYLKYFNNYTANNCWTECVSNYTFKKCGCVSFYMPHNDSQQICGETSSKCVDKAEEELIIEESQSQEGCHCLPACIVVDYDAEILKTEYHRDKWLQSLAKMANAMIPEDRQGLKYSRLEVYYKRPRFLSMRRSELFGTTEFLANCGGLLGLFMGFSFLTLVELFYFLTLRLWCTLKKDVEEEKKQAKIEIVHPKQTY